MIAVSQADFAQLQAVVAELTQAWNLGDARRYAETFASDGEQINIFGTQLHGRKEIAERHDRIFKTIFRQSVNLFEIVDARTVSPQVFVARVFSVVTVPHGPLRGELRTVASLVLRRTAQKLEIVLFHNTRLAPDEASKS